MENETHRENILNKNSIVEKVINIIKTEDSQLRDELIDDFIKKRQSEIPCYSEKYFPNWNTSIVSEFIDPKTIIKPSKLSINGYYFNDNNIYKNVMIKLAELNKFEPIEQSNYSIDIVDMTFYSMAEYFGNIYLSKSQQEKRSLFLSKNSNTDFDYEKDMKVPGISSFKEKNFGVCLDKAVFAHNCYLLFGLEDSIANGKAYFSDSQEKYHDLHVFNVLKIKDRQFIIDNTLVAEMLDINDNEFPCPQIILLPPEKKDDFYNKKPISLKDRSDTPKRIENKIIYQLER